MSKDMDSQQSDGSSYAQIGPSSLGSIAQMKILYGVFYEQGQKFFEDEKYHEALRCFNAAFQAL